MKTLSLGLLLSLCLLLGCDELSVTSPPVLLTAQGERLATPCGRLPVLPVQQAGLPQQFDLLVWNLYKLQRPGWADTLAEVPADLLLFQESVDAPSFTRRLTEQGYAWQQVAAFTYQGRTAGVMTAARTPELFSCPLAYPEPVFRLPKSALVSLYALEGSRYPLLVVNLHGVNFDLGTASYEEQLAPLLKLARRYPGPVLFGGDFNSWSERRSRLLQQRMARQQLLPAHFNPDQRLRIGDWPLDQVFYRGLVLLQASATPNPASDHNPLRLRFRLAEEATSSGKSR
ncbi:endonuclease/exonuclease/phosphatase family protein [Pseudaeromonas paramecii]|uniref:Endonuclease/exonuclease/phosphatase family protein n=1 Tax=Pseudaeromonas paramecii TaxID=2138166 RepID=A0ABP8Q2F5_9GAMM